MARLFFRNATKRLKCILLFMVLQCMFLSVHAVEFSLDTPWNELYKNSKSLQNRDLLVQEIVVQGEITSGDAERLLGVIKKHENLYRIVLDSPGGSMSEALRMAEIIKFAYFDTMVKPGKICASVCFFLFYAGSERSASPVEMMSKAAQQNWKSLQRRHSTPRPMNGFVGLHRPYFKNSTGIDGQQTELMRRVSIYMEQQLIPHRLTDLMMSRPSNDIYWLTDADLMELGSYGVDLEEYFVQKCGYLKNAVQKSLELATQGRGKDGVDMIEKEEKASKCVEAVKNSLRRSAQKKILNGWKPSVNPI